MDVAIERMTGIAFLVVGLSHIARPREWAQFFVQLSERGAPGAFTNGMMSLALGALIVGFHGTQLSGLPALVTFVGWAQVVKGLLNLCFPAYGLRSMAWASPEKAWKFTAAGILMLPFAAVILVGSIRA